jgi:hypothetical protein
MSATAWLDLRYPIGGLFVAIGLMLSGYGLATNGDVAHYAPSAGLNINLWWGLVLLVVGVLFLLSTRFGAKPSAARPAESTPEGRATEGREHLRGLEK